MNTLHRLPAMAVLCHIFEEFVWPGGFPAWDRSYGAAMAASITPGFAVIGHHVLRHRCLI